MKKTIIALCFLGILLSGCITETIDNIDFRSEKQKIAEELKQRIAEELLEEIKSYPEATACPVIPACPDCSCKATCSSKAEVFEACHLPTTTFLRPSKIMSYTGFSNIPSIFMGNELVTVKQKGEVFYPGCFYGFEDGDEMKVHRLMGVYEDYLIFKGDNNGKATETVEKDAVKFLVREVRFT